MQVELSSHYCIYMMKPQTLHLDGMIVCIVILCLMLYFTCFFYCDGIQS